MGNNNSCPKGFVAIQQQSCPDNSAVGIQNIYQSLTNPTLFFIVLTNGVSYPITLPAGTPGATGAIGATGPAGASGTVVLYNNFADLATTQTAKENLDQFTIAANQLVNDGDEIDITAAFIINPNSGGANQTVGLALSSGQGLMQITAPPSISRVVFNIRMVRISGTQVTIQGTAATQVPYGGFAGGVQQSTVYELLAATINYTFGSTNTVLAQATSHVIGDITSESLAGYYLAAN